MDEIQTKVLKVFLIAIHSHLYSFAWDFYFFKLTQPLTVSVKRKEENMVEIHTETSSLRTLKDYAPKPQCDCKMNSVSGHLKDKIFLDISHLSVNKYMKSRKNEKKVNFLVYMVGSCVQG